MTQDEQLDRLERSLRLFLNKSVRGSSSPRMTADKLGAYVKALKDRDSARELLAEKPGDSEVEKTLRKAQEVLDRTRGELRR
jgi:hypothetical protein